MSSRVSLPIVAAVSIAAMAVGLVIGGHTSAQTSAPDAAPVRCNEQTPHDFLIRGNWQVRGRMTPDERTARRDVHQRAIRFRTENYGFFPGFGQRGWNANSPMENSAWTTFFGLRVRLNRRVLPAVACVEAEIRSACTATPYTPVRLSGIRDRNTYHNGEISNHVYGIAIDIDPNRNTCCGCVAPWNEHPLCRRDVDSIYDRMAMPECWVHAFEKYGFYWLGNDQLRDTMHFEFLSDPDRIVAP